MSPPVILAIDASEQACSVALSVANETVFEKANEQRKHAELILPMVESVLQKSGIHLRDVTAIAFARGPGSFTGVRIGTAMVQGLAFSFDIPVIPISTLELLAFQAVKQFNAERILVAMDARMDEIYCAGFHYVENQLQEVLGECVISPEAVAEKYSQVSRNWNSPVQWFGFGSGWIFRERILSGFDAQKTSLDLSGCEVDWPAEAQFLIPLAVEKLKRGAGIKASQVVPVYLRDEVAWKKS